MIVHRYRDCLLTRYGHNHFTWLMPISINKGNEVEFLFQRKNKCSAWRMGNSLHLNSRGKENRGNYLVTMPGFNPGCSAVVWEWFRTTSIGVWRSRNHRTQDSRGISRGNKGSCGSETRKIPFKPGIETTTGLVDTLLLETTVFNRQIFHKKTDILFRKGAT